MVFAAIIYTDIDLNFKVDKVCCHEEGAPEKSKEKCHIPWAHLEHLKVPKRWGETHKSMDGKQDVGDIAPRSNVAKVLRLLLQRYWPLCRTPRTPRTLTRLARLARLAGGICVFGSSSPGGGNHGYCPQTSSVQCTACDYVLMLLLLRPSALYAVYPSNIQQVPAHMWDSTSEPLHSHLLNLT